MLDGFFSYFSLNININCFLDVIRTPGLVVTGLFDATTSTQTFYPRPLSKQTRFVAN